MELKIDNIIFWSTQFKEHCFFIDIGLIDDQSTITELKIISKQWYKYWENISNIDLNDINLSDINDIIFNCQFFKKFKENVIDHIKNGFCGWLIPDFVDHLKDEVEYFVNVLTDKIEPSEVIKFWTEINRDHCQTIYQLLDSSEGEVFDKSLNFSKELSIIHKNMNQENEQFYLLSLHCIDQLDIFVDQLKIRIYSRDIKSVIHPLLIDHIEREGKRSLYDISMALKSIENS